MELKKSRTALQLLARVSLQTGLLLRSGNSGEYADTAVERTPDGRLHVNGYVWSSLLRRALHRLKQGSDLADSVGKYDPVPNDSETASGDQSSTPRGVSPLWCESAFADLPCTNIVPGVRVDREFGSVQTGALYQQEVAPAGIQMNIACNLFLASPEEVDHVRSLLLQALWVVDQGIETIGGGWSYGYGRLGVQSVHTRALDLTFPRHRAALWEFEPDQQWQAADVAEGPVAKPWSRLRIEAEIADGQLMAVKTSIPPLELSAASRGDKLPDTFAFQSRSIQPDGQIESSFVIPGKAFRQAILSSSLERRLRTMGESVCLDSSAQTKESCGCKRCRWFGSIDSRGLVSVGDAKVEDSEALVLTRVQLCEHSMQNMNMFSGEYLNKGRFVFDLLVDRSRGGLSDPEELLFSLREHLNSIQNGSPPGWYRIGGTSTCTGQIGVTDIKQESYGDQV